MKEADVEHELTRIVHGLKSRKNTDACIRQWLREKANAIKKSLWLSEIESKFIYCELGLSFEPLKPLKEQRLDNIDYREVITDQGQIHSPGIIVGALNNIIDYLNANKVGGKTQRPPEKKQTLEEIIQESLPLKPHIQVATHVADNIRAWAREQITEYFKDIAWAKNTTVEKDLLERFSK